MKVTCLGSLKVDLGVELSRAFPVHSDSYEVQPIEVALGGTAGNFAAAAAGRLEDVSCIAAVGVDAWTTSLRQSLNALGVRAELFEVPVSNALVISIRGRGESEGQRRRLLISAEESPHRHLTQQHVKVAAALIESSDVLVSDTYFLQSQTSAQSLLDALRVAAGGGTKVVLDILPHDLGRNHDASFIAPYVAHANVVVVEARTLSALTRSEAPWEVSGRLSPSYIERARDIQPRAVWLVRWGTANIGMTTRIEPDGMVWEYSTTYPIEPEKHGFGDRLLVQELAAGLFG